MTEIGTAAAPRISISTRRIRRRAARAFNERFWNATGGYLYDVVDGEHGDDPACRPNQVLAISLDHPVLDRARWTAVMQVVRDRLLTPVGLRSLAPGHPGLQVEVLRRSAVPRRGVSSGDGLGVADRSVRRCVAEGLPARSTRAHAAAPRLRRAPERGVRRIDQRDLRRRRAVRCRAAASRRPGASPKCCAACWRRRIPRTRSIRTTIASRMSDRISPSEPVAELPAQSIEAREPQ